MRLLLLLCMFTTSSLHASIGAKLILSEGLDQPVWLGAAPGDSTRLFILEKAGRVRIYDTTSETLLEEPFLDIRNKIKIRMNEQGLLGMAFEPDYQKNGRFYLYLTNTKGDTEILRYEGKGNKAKQSSMKQLLTFKQDFRNHNGGWIGFGPDKALYIATGDGGSGDDPKARAQDLTSLLGKILRLNVIGEDSYTTKGNPFTTYKPAQPEIYAFGLRNPWRCFWDLEKNEFYIADVGQKLWEEINWLPQQKLKGANFGWRIHEGLLERPKYDDLNQTQSTTTEPVYVYKHGTKDNEGLSITGGVVYQGSIKELQGHYFFSDWNRHRTWSIHMNNGKATEFQDWTDRFNEGLDGKITTICSYGVDSHGEMYLVSHDGRIHKIVKR